MILHTVVIHDNDHNMQTFLGETREEVILSLLKNFGPEIYAIDDKTEAQFKEMTPDNQVMCIVAYFQGMGVRWWLQEFTVEAPESVEKKDPTMFPITSVCREDISICTQYTKEDLDKVEDHTMERIAGKMSDDYLSQMYWSSLETIAEHVIGTIDEEED